MIEFERALRRALALLAMIPPEPLPEPRAPRPRARDRAPRPSARGPPVGLAVTQPRRSGVRR